MPDTSTLTAIFDNWTDDELEGLFRSWWLSEGYADSPTPAIATHLAFGRWLLSQGGRPHG